MKLIIARSEWMTTYSGEEELEDPRGIWSQSGNLPGEAFNFEVAPDGKCYGFWEMGLKSDGSTLRRMKFRDWPEKGKKFADDVCVVFVATDPVSRRFFVVGFYHGAKVLAEGRSRPGGLTYRAVAHAKDCYLIPCDERIFEYRYRSRQSWFTYGDEDKDASLISYVASIRGEFPPLKQDADQFVVEGRRSVLSRRMERFQSGYLKSLVIKSDKDLHCAACDLSHGCEDHPALKRRFEVHHLERVADLADGEIREVRAKDLIVVCASCHRALHSPEAVKYVSNVSAFRREVLGLKK